MPALPSPARSSGAAPPPAPLSLRAPAAALRAIVAAWDAPRRGAANDRTPAGAP